MRHPLPELPPRLFCQPSSSQIGTAMVLDDEALHGIAGVVGFPCSIWPSCSRLYLWHGRGVCLKSCRQWSSGQIGGQWCVFFEWIPNDFTSILSNLYSKEFLWKNVWTCPQFRFVSVHVLEARVLSGATGETTSRGSIYAQLLEFCRKASFAMFFQALVVATLL